MVVGYCMIIVNSAPRASFAFIISYLTRARGIIAKRLPLSKFTSERDNTS